MKKINFMKLASLVIALLATSSLFAQGINDVRINEILVNNVNGIVNCEGNATGWIELTNTGYTTIDLGGCRLEKVSTNGTKTTHVLPKGLSSTKLAPQNYMIIYFGADNIATNATCFDLKDAKSIILYDVSGKMIVDKVMLDLSSVKDNQSLGRDVVDRSNLSGRRADSNIDTRSDKMVSTYSPTPGNSNFPISTETRGEAFLRVDPYGIGMAVIAMSVVFLALLCLFLIFQQVGIVMQNISKRKEIKSVAKTTTTSVSSAQPDFNSEILVAIGYAVSRYNKELKKAKKLTINRTAKSYSPWGSKIYGLTQLPNRK